MRRARLVWLKAHPAAWLAAAAVALRLVLFLGRGDYVAYDEGWYLLLGRNLLSGEGYTLAGLRHVALSPLFPILAGTLDRVLGDPVWAGRIVAALTGGLLVVPCWSIFRRLGGPRTALIGCLVVAALPALAPFVAAYWIGWDLWVGAEPVLHLFLFTGVALFLRLLDRGRAADAALAGAAFALAYLARPEAVLPLGFLGLGLGALALARRSPRLALRGAGLALAFALVAAPYWLYLRDSLGEWALTGRGVHVGVPRLAAAPAAHGRDDRPAAIIQRMLWQDDEADYIRNLYSLDGSGVRLASTYWGVPAPASASAPPPTAQRADPTDKPSPHPAPPSAAAAEPPGLVGLYARSIGRIVPIILWPFMVAGVLLPRRRRRLWLREAFFTAPILATSVLIAIAVAVDPRTQLFVLPVFAFYSARGIRLFGTAAARGLRGSGLRRRFPVWALTATVVLLLLGTSARRLYLSLAVGSPHHLVGAENRRTGEALRRLVPADKPVMSWHPAIALYARRDWRVLPAASFAEILRYAEAVGCEHVVLSAYYPAPAVLEQVAAEYLVLRVEPGTARAGRWRIDLVDGEGSYLVGWVRPV